MAGGFDGLQRVPQPANPEAALRTGLRKQRKTTVKALGAIAGALAGQGLELACAGILVSRGRPAATFDKAIGAHTQIHIEEGIAVRESFRAALTKADVVVHDIDRKSLAAIASKELARGEVALLAELSEIAPGNGGAWLVEYKRAALAAWVAWIRKVDSYPHHCMDGGHFRASPNDHPPGL